MLINTNENKIVTKTGIELILYTHKYKDTEIHELFNPQISSDMFVLYIHGGPNLSCKQYIEETINGGVRALDGIIQFSHLILVEQKGQISSDEIFLNQLQNKDEVRSKFESVISKYGPKALSKIYTDIIKIFLGEKKYQKYGIVAQSFGAQILLNFLDSISKKELHPKFVAFSSPFLGVNDSTTFILDRRTVLKNRSQEIMKFLSDNHVEFPKQRAMNLQISDQAYHKLACEIANPAYPAGIIVKNIISHLRNLNNSDDDAFIRYFNEIPQQDIINFVIGSQYFTPGSNIYKATLIGIEEVAFEKDNLDESIWVKHFLELQYSNTLILDYDTTSNYDLLLEELILFTRIVPTYMYLDPEDFAIPVENTIKKVVSQIDDKAIVMFREGYGHWIGHSTISRILQEV